MTKPRPRIIPWLFGALVVTVCALLVWIGQVTREPDERRQLTTMIAAAQQAMQGRDFVTDYTTKVSGIDRVEVDATLRDETTGEQVADLLDDLAESFSLAGVDGEPQDLHVELDWTLEATAMGVTASASSPEGSQGFAFAEELRTRLTAATSRAGQATEVTLDGNTLIIEYGTVDRVPSQLSSLDDAESGFPGGARGQGVTKVGHPTGGIGELFDYQDWNISCLNALCGSASEFEAFIAALPPSTGQSLWVFHDPYGGPQRTGYTWTLISRLDPEAEPRDATLTQDNAGGFVAALDRLCADPTTQRVGDGYALTAGPASSYNSVTVSYLCTVDGLQVNPEGQEKLLAEELLAVARQA